MIHCLVARPVKLLEYGLHHHLHKMDINQKMLCGHTPLYSVVKQIAKGSNYADIAKLLIKFGATTEQFDDVMKLIYNKLANELSIENDLFRPEVTVSASSSFQPDELTEIQQKVTNHNIRDLFEQGDIPVGKWESLLAELSEASLPSYSEKILNVRHQLTDAKQRVATLEKQLQEMEGRQLRVKSLDLSKFQEIVDVEKEIEEEFHIRIADPEWSLDQMTHTDFYIVMANFKLDHLIPSFKEQLINSLEFLVQLDHTLLADLVPPIDYYQLLYCLKLVQNQIFYPNDQHTKDCCICSSNLADLMKEYNYPPEAIQIAIDQCHTVEKLLCLPGGILWRTLPLSLKLKASQASNELLKKHSWMTGP